MEHRNTQKGDVVQPGNITYISTLVYLSIAHIFIFLPGSLANTYFFDEIVYLTRFVPASYADVVRYTLNDHWVPLFNLIAKVTMAWGGPDSRLYGSTTLMATLVALGGLFILMRHFQATWQLVSLCLSLVAFSGILIPIYPWPAIFTHMMAPLGLGLFSLFFLFSSVDRNHNDLGFLFLSLLLFTLALYVGESALGFLPAIFFFGLIGRGANRIFFVLSIVLSVLLYIYLRSLFTANLFDLSTFSLVEYVAVVGLDIISVLVGWLFKLPPGYLANKLDLNSSRLLVYIIGTAIGSIPCIILFVQICSRKRGQEWTEWIRSHRPFLLGFMVVYGMNGLIYLGRMAAIHSGPLDITRQDYYHIPTMGGCAFLLFAFLQYLKRFGRIWSAISNNVAVLSFMAITVLSTYSANHIYWHNLGEENLFGKPMLQTAEARKIFFNDLYSMVTHIHESDAANNLHTVLPDIPIRYSVLQPTRRGIQISQHTMDMMQAEGLDSDTFGAFLSIRGKEFTSDKAFMEALDTLDSSSITAAQKELILKHADTRVTLYSGLQDAPLSAYARGLAPSHCVSFQTGLDSMTLTLPSMASVFYNKYFPNLKYLNIDLETEK